MRRDSVWLGIALVIACAGAAVVVARVAQVLGGGW